MRPLRTRLQEARARLAVPWEVLERDYLLSWILAGITQVDELERGLVFKGGTALKKCYFGDQYRFSEDLDFTCSNEAPRGESLERAIVEACRAATVLLDEYAPVELHVERYTEREPHPTGQEAFTIHAQLPWHRRPHTRVMVEATMDEEVLRPAPKRKILHAYGERFDAEISVYAPEEIVAEKLRSILQCLERLEERGWSRSRARDYYDLWRLLHAFEEQMDLSDFPSLLRTKCQARGVAFSGPDDFFQEPVLNHVERTWHQWLGPLVPNLPGYDPVIADLRSKVAQLLA